MSEYLEINISNKIKEDSSEYKSLLELDKHGNMQSFNIKTLNTRGRENEPAKIGRNMKFKLDRFDILHFDKIELVTTSGGAFHNGKLIQESCGGFGTHTFVNTNYANFKKLQKRCYIPLNITELKQTIKVVLSAILGKEQKRLKSDNAKILYHSANWDCFSHFSFEEFPRLLATLKAMHKIGGGQQGYFRAQDS